MENPYKIKVDHSQAGTERKPLPTGKNRCVITEVSIKPSKDPMKSDQLQVILEGSESKNKDHSLVDYLVFSEKAMWRHQMLFKAARIPDGYDFDYTDESDVKMLGKHEIVVVVNAEEYTDNSGNRQVAHKVKHYWPCDNSGEVEDSGSSGKNNKPSDVDDIPF